uniref:(northern house mosquito) hypothetical protein n=1 Tax=Culex pipiens TaxID=7175 RepID=A0A8D8AG65_CULPI
MFQNFLQLPLPPLLPHAGPFQHLAQPVPDRVLVGEAVLLQLGKLFVRIGPAHLAQNLLHPGYVRLDHFQALFAELALVATHRVVELADSVVDAGKAGGKQVGARGLALHHHRTVGRLGTVRGFDDFGVAR